MEITKREILVSVAIIAVMLSIGLIIYGKISDYDMTKNQDYSLAAKIEEDADLFQYCMRTNIGNAFVYGELKAVDTVTYPEIGGAYSSVKKVKEEYTMHIRTVRVKCGNTWTTETETYWTWDEVDSWNEHANEISFLGVKFDYGTIKFPSRDYICEQDESPDVRYVYYGAPAECLGTIYAELRGNTISNVSGIYEGQSIEDVLSHMTSNWGGMIFWLVWICLTGTLVFGFCYLENRWLED